MVKLVRKPGFGGQFLWRGIEPVRAVAVCVAVGLAGGAVVGLSLHLVSYREL